MGGLRVTYAQGMYVPMRVGEQLEPLRCSQARLLEWVSTLCRVPRVPARERCEVITPLQNGRCGGGSGRCEQVSAPDLALEEQEAGSRKQKQKQRQETNNRKQTKQRGPLQTAIGDTHSRHSCIPIYPRAPNWHSGLAALNCTARIYSAIRIVHSHTLPPVPPGHRLAQ